MNVGKLGIETFLPGYYVYTGSALGKGATSLPNRLARHLKTLKKKHWHIDFLLSKTEASIEAIAAVSGTQNSECEINQFIRSQMKAKVLIPKFGASDCKNNCESHLLFFPDITKEEKLTQRLVKALQLKFEGKPIYVVWACSSMNSAKCKHQK